MMTQTTASTTQFRHVSPPVAVPCPAWCTTEPGHGYEIEDERGHQGRFHEAGAASNGRRAFAHISAEAYWVGGNEVVSPATIAVVIGGDVHENHIATPAAARALAASLLAAAGDLEAIQ